MQVCIVLHAARWKYKIAKLSPFGHHRTTLTGYVFATKAHIDNRNKNSSGDEIANVNFFYNIAHVEASAYAH